MERLRALQSRLEQGEIPKGTFHRTRQGEIRAPTTQPRITAIDDALDAVGKSIEYVPIPSRGGSLDPDQFERSRSDIGTYREIIAAAYRITSAMRTGRIVRRTETDTVGVPLNSPWIHARRIRTPHETAIAHYHGMIQERDGPIQAAHGRWKRESAELVAEKNRDLDDAQRVVDAAVEMHERIKGVYAGLERTFELGNHGWYDNAADLLLTNNLGIAFRDKEHRLQTIEACLSRAEGEVRRGLADSRESAGRVNHFVEVQRARAYDVERRFLSELESRATAIRERGEPYRDAMTGTPTSFENGVTLQTDDEHRVIKTLGAMVNAERYLDTVQTFSDEMEAAAGRVARGDFSASLGDSEQFNWRGVQDRVEQLTSEVEFDGARTYVQGAVSQVDRARRELQEAYDGAVEQVRQRVGDLRSFEPDTMSHAQGQFAGVLESIASAEQFGLAGITSATVLEEGPKSELESASEIIADMVQGVSHLERVRVAGTRLVNSLGQGNFSVQVELPSKKDTGGYAQAATAAASKLEAYEGIATYLQGVADTESTIGEVKRVYDAAKARLVESKERYLAADFRVEEGELDATYTAISQLVTSIGQASDFSFPGVSKGRVAATESQLRRLRELAGVVGSTREFLQSSGDTLEYDRAVTAFELAVVRMENEIATGGGFDRWAADERDHAARYWGTIERYRPAQAPDELRADRRVAHLIGPTPELRTPDAEKVELFMRYRERTAFRF